jgi:hypothetical protein
MPSHDLKHLRFDYHVPSDNLMDWKGQLPVVHVQYSLHWNKKVTLDGYSMKPGIAVQIKDWNRLESDLQLAAENNSEGHRLPGDHRGGRMRPEGKDAYQDIHDRWKQETKQKEYYGH